MGKFFGACLLVLALLPGCASIAETGVPPRGQPTISLSRAEQLMLSGEVIGVFQPHVGCVVLTLKNGELETFEQPYLDWVLHFVRERKLEHIPVSME